MNSNFYFNNLNFKEKIIHYPLGYPFKEKIISLSTRDSSYRHLILGYKKTCKQTGIFATYTVPICFVLLQQQQKIHLPYIMLMFWIKPQTNYLVVTAHFLSISLPEFH